LVEGLRVVAVSGAAGRGLFLLLGKEFDPRARSAVNRVMRSTRKILLSIDDLKIPAKRRLTPSGDVSKCSMGSRIRTLQASVNNHRQRSPVSVAPKWFTLAEAKYRSRQNELSYVSTKDFGPHE